MLTGNIHAISILNKVKNKLGGRDPNINIKQTIPEQIDWIIQQSVSPDNLSVMYEGWISWW